ncbi:hypothetical protein D3C77_707380 [compost metagenome]
MRLTVPPLPAWTTSRGTSNFKGRVRLLIALVSAALPPGSVLRQKNITGSPTLNRESGAITRVAP